MSEIDDDIEESDVQDIFELYEALVTILQNIMEELEATDASIDTKKDFQDIYQSTVQFISKQVE
ncbi:MAG TPA: hypothetical protein ENI61_04195 [Ignavibacteria bacterium]|nr:hypothetical protein [Ignavibacteria bacterium]